MKNLDKRKVLASKVLGVGKNRIVFDSSNLEDIKEAITKQDIRDFYEQGVITIKPIKGRRQKVKRKTKKSHGKFKIKVKRRKEEHVKLIRKLRNHLKELKKQGRLDVKKYKEFRVKVKSKIFKSKAHLKEHIGV